MNPHEPQIHRQLPPVNEQSARDADIDFEAAERRLQKLQADASFRALRMGVRGVADTVSNPELQERMAKQALMEQYVALQGERERPKGPARPQARKVDPRKRQRQARKRSR